MGEAAYRAKQIFSWVHQQGAIHFSEMTNLPQTFLREMKKSFDITTLTLREQKASENGETEKFLWELGDGEYVETVLIKTGKRRTICVSTQVGCKFGCPFCASGTAGFTRDLVTAEIVGQLLSVQRAAGGRLTNMVFMGMGEALDNYDNIEKAIKIINHSAGINLGARKITVSTCGVVPGIKKLAGIDPHVELSVSLHSLDEKTRDKLVPVNRRYPLKVLLPACREYRERTGRAVTIEYTLIKGINDSDEDARKLRSAAKEIKAKVNLIACSRDAGREFEPPGEGRAKRFRTIVKEGGVTVTIRTSKGGDIEAACGQLAGKRKMDPSRPACKEKRKFKLIVFDIDGTITKHVSSWRYIHEKLGLWDILAKKYQEQFLAGKISYKRFCELDADNWKGIEEKKMRDIFQKVEYSKNAEKTIEKLKEKGFKLAAISTGLQFIAERVKKELKFDYTVGNRLDVRKGILTGGVTISISHGAKGATLRSILRRFKVTPEEMIAVGDSSGDVPMVKLAGYSIAFNSSSEELSKLVDHDCATLDFMEVYGKILEVTRERGS